MYTKRDRERHNDLYNRYYELSMQVGLLRSQMDTVLTKITSGEKFTTDLLKTLKLETYRVEAVPAHGIIRKAGPAVNEHLRRARK